MTVEEDQPTVAERAEKCVCQAFKFEACTGRTHVNRTRVGAGGGGEAGSQHAPNQALHTSSHGNIDFLS